MTRREFLRALGGGATALAMPARQAPGEGAAAGKRPNIVLIMADDMGFTDLGCYGGEIGTPNLDRLAADGLRFGQFYNCALCGPSRAALMTGLYPHQAGVGERWTGLLSKRSVTIVELLKQAGYATNVVGRLDMVTADNWHDPQMIRRHADHFFGSTGHVGPGNYFQAVRDTPFHLDGKPYQVPLKGFYKTDALTDYAVRFIGEAAKRAGPFFLYAAYNAPHWPLHAKEADIARYRRTYRALGWDELRARRYKRLTELGLIDARCPLSPRDPRVPPWNKAAHQRWEAERMAVYAAQIDCMDRNIGRILGAIRKAGAEQNTLVLFLSDNGPSDQAWPRQLDRKGRPWRRDGTPTRVGNKPTIMPGGPDTFVTYGPPWANVSNTPLRLYKGTSHEGGIATPLIAYWPQVIKPGGAITQQVGHIIDIMATCLDVAGVAYPPAFGGRKVLPLEGKSLLPIFQGKRREGHEALCWQLRGSRAVRMGKWKLVALRRKPWELYDMEADRAETNNLADRYPQRVKEMTAIHRAWARRCGVVRPGLAAGAGG